MGQALQSLAEEDPTIQVQTISATKQTLLQGMGDAHVDVNIRRLDSKFGVKVDTSGAQGSLSGDRLARGQRPYRHKKQSGGAGQFAEVHMRVGPTDRGEGFEYASEIFGGSISGVFLPSIEKGVNSVLETGVIAGYPVVDVKAIVYDGKEHPVDSKDIAFQTAGREAFKAAMQQAGPVLLEPIYNIEVTIPKSTWATSWAISTLAAAACSAWSSATIAPSSGRRCPGRDPALWHRPALHDPGPRRLYHRIRPLRSVAVPFDGRGCGAEQAEEEEE